MANATMRVTVSRLATYEPHFRRLLESPSLQGSNPVDDDFCTFFVMKDAYAQSFVAIELLQEALEQYAH